MKAMLDVISPKIQPQQQQRSKAVPGSEGDSFKNKFAQAVTQKNGKVSDDKVKVPQEQDIENMSGEQKKDNESTDTAYQMIVMPGFIAVPAQQATQQSETLPEITGLSIEGAQTQAPAAAMSPLETNGMAENVAKQSETPEELAPNTELKSENNENKAMQRAAFTVKQQRNENDETRQVNNADAKSEVSEPSPIKPIVKAETHGGTQVDVKSKENGGEDAPDMTAVVFETKPALNLSNFNVQVADVVDVSDGQMAEKLAEKVLMRMSEGKKEFQIQLNPRDLGKIDIKIVFEAGKAVVTMLAENPKTQNMLMASSESIRSIVQGNTGAETLVNVEHKEPDFTEQQSSKENHQGRQQEQRRPRREDDTISFMSQLRLGLVSLTN